jgi:hypothetical protein
MAAPNKRKPVEKRPAVDNALRPVLERYAGHKVMRLLGYWVCVQTYGGWEGVAAQPFWPEGSVQRWRLEFREAFGMEAEDYVPETGSVLRQALYGTDVLDAHTLLTEEERAERVAELKENQRKQRARRGKS